MDFTQQLIKDFIAVVVPEQHFIQVEVKVVLTDATRLRQPAPGDGPETFQAIDPVSAVGSFNAVRDGPALITEQKRPAGLETAGFEHASLCRKIIDVSHQGLARDIVHNGGKYPDPALQQPKDLRFAWGTIAANSPAFTAPITRLTFDLTRQFLTLLAQIGRDFLGVLRISAAYLGITTSQVRGRYVGRYLKAEIMPDLQVIARFLWTLFIPAATLESVTKDHCNCDVLRPIY